VNVETVVSFPWRAPDAKGRETMLPLTKYGI